MNTRAGIFILIFMGVAAVGGWFALGRSQHDILITDVVAEPFEDGLRVFARVENEGAADRLLGVESAAASDVKIAGITEGYQVVLPKGGAALLAEDGAFLVLREISGPLDLGRILPLAFRFERAGVVRTKARVVGTASAQVLPTAGRLEPVDNISVSLDVTRRPSSGDWKITVSTEGFTFQEPIEDVGHRPGFGHAHLYLNGVKLGRLYAPEAEVGALPSGPHVLSVTLNTNDHRPYANGRIPVRSEQRIEVPR